MSLKNIFPDIKRYFNVASDLEPQPAIEESIRSGVPLRGATLLTLIFAILVASLGLNTNSVAVIIGAMLISPLMGPIIGMGLGIGIHDYGLLRRGFKNIALAMLGSVAASAVFFLISPQYEGTSQLLARTSPTIYDAFIAFFGGAAGILSIAAKNKGQVLPGVAIATSLMPPLCTAGYGIATWQLHFFFGALYLFFTNMVFILFSAWIGVKLMGLKPVPRQDTARAKRVQVIVYLIVIATVGVSAYLTSQMIRKSIFEDKATTFVTEDLHFPNAEILSHNIYMSGNTGHIEVTLIGEHMPQDSLELAVLKQMDAAGLGGTQLVLRQGYTPGSLPKDGEGEDISRMYSLMQTQLNERQHTIDSISALLSHNRQLQDAATALAPEVRVVFPKVAAMAVSRTVAAPIGQHIVETDSTARMVEPDTVTMVLIQTPYNLSWSERTRLSEYCAVRLGLPKVSLIINPSHFPWPD